MAVDISKYYFRSRPVLDALPRQDLLLFKEHLVLRKIRKGRELFQEDTRPRGVFILKRGKVKIYQQTQNGDEQIVYIYTPGEMLGYRPILSHQNHPTSAMTLEESGIYFLPEKHFLATLKKSAALSNILLQNLSHEFTVLVNRIGAFSHKSAKERIALSLLILQEKYRKEGKGHVEITLSRAALAGFVGTTNERLARIVSAFKREKIIKIFGRKIIIADATALYSMAE